MRFCRTAVVVQGMYQSLEVELKDQHGNPVDKDKENNAVLIQVFLSEVQVLKLSNLSQSIK